MKKRKRKIISEMIRAVKLGHAFTLHDTDGKPQALVMPWKDWTALNAKLVELEKRYVAPGDIPMAQHQRLLAEADTRERMVWGQEIPEDLWGQGDVSHAVPTRRDEHGVLRTMDGARVYEPPLREPPEVAMMATQADEDELKERYGKGSEELADEAEAGYDTAGMLSREKQAMRKYGLQSHASVGTAETDDDEGDFLSPEKIQ